MWSLPVSLVELLSVVFRNSWQACVLIVLIALVQWVFRKHLTAQWRYGLWFLLLVRLALPSTPQTNFSVFNWLSGNGQDRPKSAVTATIPAGQQNGAVRSGPPSVKPLTDSSPSAGATLHIAARPAAQASSRGSQWREKAVVVLFWCWISGVLVLLWRVVLGTWRLARGVRAIRPVVDSTLLNLLEDCKQLMGVTTPVIIIETAGVKSPMLYGFLRPRLLLPTGLIDRFSREELRFVLLHELAHVKRGDIVVNWFATVLQIVHWFNPLVWIAFWRMRADRELACDSLVLARSQASEHHYYAATVLKLLEGFTRPVPIPSLLGILETKDEIKRRLLSISNFTRPHRWSPTGIGSVLALALLTLTDSQRASGLSSAADRDEGGTWHRRASGSLHNGPSLRVGHSSIWTGKELIIWGGGSQSVVRNDGARYDLASDTWRPMSLSNAPSPRWLHAAIWTGTEMIVWGGRAQFENLQVRGDGARYNPVTDTWTALPAKDAPSARSEMGAVWTGTEMVIWGGSGEGWVLDPKAARYNPRADAWQPLSEKNAPEPRQEPSAVWTGNEMIIWGGVRNSPDHIYFNSGGRYDPVRDIWLSLPTNGPSARARHTAVWTGSEMIIWGGHTDIRYHNTGARFDPARNTWKPTTLVRAAQRRMGHCAVWTGSEMIVWGGMTSPYDLTWNGGRYDPDADEWSHLTNIGAPAARLFHRNDGAVWTGTGMLIFGGGTGRIEFDSNYLWSPTGSLRIGSL